MKYCSHCGSEVVDDAVVCPKCGCAIEGANNPAPKTNSGSASGLSIAGLVLAFFIPLVGLILSIVARNNAKQIYDEKSAGLAKAGIILSVVFLVINVITVAIEVAAILSM